MKIPRQYRWAFATLSKLSRVAMSRRLDEVYLRIAQAPRKLDDFPMIYYANHVCFWDSHIAILLNKQFKRKFFMLINSRVMEVVPILSWIGCFEVNRGDPLAIMRSIKMASEILNRTPNCGMWIFPQGTHMRNDHRPLKMLPGLAKIVAGTERVCITPVAIRYEMFGGPKPTAFVSVGISRIFEGSKQIDLTNMTQGVEAILTKELDGLNSDLLNGTAGSFQPILNKSSRIFTCRGHRFRKKHVEVALGQIPGVQKVKVIPVYHEVYGDAMEIHIESNDNRKLDEVRLKQHCRRILGNELADFILPATSIFFHEKMPKNTGV